MAATAFQTRGEFRYTLEGFHGKLCNNLFYMWQSSQLCDLTLKLSDEDTIRVHSCLLAAFSPTIADILANVDAHFQEKGEYSQKYVTVDIQKFSARVIKIIVSAIYTGELVVGSMDIMEPLLVACRWLRIGDLILVLEEAMRERNINTSQSNEELFSASAKLLSPTPFSEDYNRDKFSSVGFSRPEQMSSDPFKPRFSALNNENLLRESRDEPTTDVSGSCGLNLMHALGDQKIPSDGPTNRNSDDRPSDVYGKSLDTPISVPVSQDDRDGIKDDSFMDGADNDDDDMGVKENGNGASNGDGTFAVPNADTSFDAGAMSDAAVGGSNNDESGNKRKRAKPKKRIILTDMESDPFADTTLNSSKEGDTEMNASGASLDMPSGSGTTVERRQQPRRGVRQKSHKAQKWVEHFFTNCLYSHDKNFLEAVVPFIKREMTVLSSYLNLSENQMVGEPGVEIKKETEDDVPASGSSDYLIDSHSLVTFYNNQDFNYAEGGGAAKTKRKTKGKTKTKIKKKSAFPRIKIGKGRRKRKVTDEDLDGDDGLDDGGEGTSGEPKVKKPRKRGPRGPYKKKKKAKVKLTTRVMDPMTEALGADAGIESAILDEETMKQAENENLRKLENGEPAKCIKCRLVFKDAEEYKAHVSNHPIFACPDCPAKFYLKRPLTTHRYAVHLDPSYLRCKFCSYQAKQAKELCAHSESEHGEPRPFKCEEPDCPFKAKKYSDVQRHFKQTHSTVLEYFCEKCGAGFTYKSLYMYHRERCLKNEKHLCYRCGSIFHAKYDLKMHIAAVHLKIKKYKCSQCDHRFASHGNLKRHMYVHNNVFPYTCPHCQEKFRHSNTFKLHVESKHGISARASNHANHPHLRLTKERSTPHERLSSQVEMATNSSSSSGYVPNLPSDAGPQHPPPPHPPPPPPPPPIAQPAHLPLGGLPAVSHMPLTSHSAPHAHMSHTAKPPLPMENYYHMDNSYHEGLHRHNVMEDAMTAATLTCLVPQWYPQMQ